MAAIEPESQSKPAPSGPRTVRWLPLASVVSGVIGIVALNSASGGIFGGVDGNVVLALPLVPALTSALVRSTRWQAVSIGAAVTFIAIAGPGFTFYALPFDVQPLERAGQVAYLLVAGLQLVELFRMLRRSDHRWALIGLAVLGGVGLFVGAVIVALAVFSGAG